MDLKGLKVTVAGISRSGFSAALLLKKMGAHVYATDNSINEEIEKNINVLRTEGIDFEAGQHTESFVKDKDLLVVSPGVSEDSPVIKWAKEHCVPIISELELGYLFCKGRVLAVTGTNGKTTAATLIGKIIRESGRPTVICGNIGTPFTSETANITGSHLVVLEVSSFQLEWIDKFKPYISIILNVTEDHLNRHASLNKYRVIKNKIFMNQEKEDFLVLNYEDRSLRDLGGSILPKILFFSRNEEVEGVFVKGKNIIWNVGGQTESICSTDIIELKGAHNLDNVLASILLCRLVGINDADIIKSISDFRPLPHRFHLFTEIEGVGFVNDSKATNVDSTIKALLSLNKPVILIAGGRDKVSDFSLAKDVIREKVRSLILIGEAKERIARSIEDAAPIRQAGTLEEAVELAYDVAERGDIVLLSPMCASFDMFRDYVERGEAFVRVVNNLKERLHICTDDFKIKNQR